MFDTYRIQVMGKIMRVCVCVCGGLEVPLMGVELRHIKTWRKRVKHD